MIQHKYKWVDVSKGIVICLMVIGHSSIPNWLSNWIWSFHMPFFFIISALFTSWDSTTIQKFTIRKSRILLIPFIIYSAINLMIYPLALGCSHLEYLRNTALFGWGGVALWFVPVFYISIIICRFTSPRYLLVEALMMLILGWLLNFLDLQLYWAISSVPFATFIMLIIRKYRSSILILIKSLSMSQNILIMILGLFVSGLISHFFRLDMASNHISPVIPIIIGIIGGTAFIITSSILLCNSLKGVANIFQHIGKNTYEVMALSQVIIATINHFFQTSIAVKYITMILILIVAVYLRKSIERKFSIIEAN